LITHENKTEEEEEEEHANIKETDRQKTHEYNEERKTAFDRKLTLVSIK